MAARRVVLVMIEPPSPFGNAAARWFYVLLRGLVARGHRVAAFAACSKPREIDEARGLFPSPDYDLRPYPFPAGGGAGSKLRTFRRPYSYMFSPELRRDLGAELAKGYDVLHLEQLWAGWLGLGHAAKAVVNIHYLARIDLADAPTSGAAGLIRHRMMLGAETRLIRAYPRITTLSPRLTEAVAAINPRAHVSTVPLGIDASLYPFGTDPAPRPPTLGLIGSFDWRPSYAAAERLMTRLWPEIRRRVPDARLLVVGRRAKSALAAFLDTPGLEIAEDVPDAIPYFRAIDALLYAPPRGSGMKVKVLEAFALGTPVVTNAEGIEGLPASDGVHAGVAEDDAGLIERAAALLRDPGLRESRRVAARALLESHCGPRPTVDAVEAVHESIAAGGRS
ncbi:MAG TPA: glycosyltransferase family 4 protein [Isosphaeraceae bacterium]|jgi:glycosyltransferase involved in cell wall biosynthesis